MITTIFLVIYFTFILTATINFNSDLIPLWIIISPVFAIFIILILVWIMTPLYKFSGNNNRFFFLCYKKCIQIYKYIFIANEINNHWI